MPPQDAGLLFANAADNEMDDYGRIDGHGVAAPARAQNAKVAAVNVEGGFESCEIADAGHHARVMGSQDAASSGHGFGRAETRPHSTRL